MVAFIVSIVATLALVGGIMWYMKRRPVGAPLTWGEAMLGATYVFLLLFLLYGVVPHQWLTWADNELGWRPDKLLIGPEMAWTGGQGLLEWALPFTLHYQVIRDIIAVVIYVIGLGGTMAVWVMWQNRDADQVEEEPTSEFGRPLVKEGATV